MSVTVRLFVEIYRFIDYKDVCSIFFDDIANQSSINKVENQVIDHDTVSPHALLNSNSS